MKNFTELREELDIILEEELRNEEFLTLEEIEFVAEELDDIDLDEEILNDVIEELVLEFEVKRGERVDVATRRQRAMDYRKNRAKKIAQMRQYRKSSGFKSLERKREMMAKKGKTATGRDITVRGGLDSAQRAREKKKELQNNEFTPELSELTTAQRLKRSRIAKVVARKAAIKREKTLKKPPTQEKIQSAIDRALRKKALSIVDKSGVYNDASPGVKSEFEKKASKLLAKKKTAWTKKIKPEIMQKMKDAYKERMGVKNPELD